MTQKEIDKEIIYAWLQGEYSIAQLRMIQEYLQDPAYRESLDKFLQEEWGADSGVQQPPLPDLEQQYDKFRSQLPARPALGPPAPVRPLVKRWIWPVAVAAALLFLVMAIWLLRPLHRAGKENVDISWITRSTTPGKRIILQLPDSSVVYLGAASTLKYDVNYNNSNRRVLLEGEAYFVVRHEGHYPFTVQLGDMAVVDIGTEFNIRHYTGQGAVEVAVAKGKVAVNSTRSGKAVRIAALAQGQGLQYDPVADKAVALDLPDTQLVGSWRKGVLAFRKRPLKDITDEMERYYGVSIRYGNPAYGALLITTLLNNRSLEEALEIVTVTAGIHYSRNGNTVLLH